MEETSALALVRNAHDELVEVRDAPDKGAGAVGCFARLPCAPICCGHFVFRRVQIWLKTRCDVPPPGLGCRHGHSSAPTQDNWSIYARTALNA